MITKTTWTPGMVSSVMLALRVTLNRVKRESIAETAIVETWDRVHAWLDEVDRLMSQPIDERQYAEVPPFPLSAQQLQALEASIDHIAQAHAVVSATDVLPSAAHIRSGLKRLHWSSYALATILLASFAVNLLNLVAFHGSNQRAIAQVDAVIAGIGLLAWGAHHWGLVSHKSVMRRLHPSANVA
jgi:hypothetical protein